MQRVFWLALLCVLVVLASAQAGGDDPRRARFFNGKDLTGWEGLGLGDRADPADDTQFWLVRDGAIVGTHKGLKFNTFLCSKQKYRDFELKFQVRLTGAGANSGVQIRSKIFNDKTLAVGGPQCDMGQQFWGCLYGEHYTPGQPIAANVGGGMMKAADAKLIKSILKENEFNDYYIKCVGKHVTIKLNGQTTVDDDFEMPDEGIIAWQLHSGGPMEVIYRNIQFTDLSK